MSITLKRKKANSVRKEWAKPKNQNFNFGLISQLSNYQSDVISNRINEKTIVDLDFKSYFKFIDRTSSAIGQQYLYNQLVNQSVSPCNIDGQERLITFYNSKLDQKFKSQLILKKLSKTNDYYFPYLIYSDLPKTIYSSWIIAILQLVVTFTFILSFKYSFAVVFLILLFTVNLSLHYFHKARTGNFTVYFSRLVSLSNALKKLLPLSNFSEKKKINLISDGEHIEKITSKILFLKTDNLQDSEFGAILWYVFELFKILTLAEISVFNKLIKKIDSTRPQIKNVYIAIGEIDLAISICSLRDGLPYYSIPNLVMPSKELTIRALYHPLVADCIPNDIELINKSMLLTGSNMAGKSTFIKAINLNAITSQVLNTSFSKYYSAPIWNIKTSMTIADNLDDNISYYMEEVASIGQLISCSESERQLYLFTIDEIFKGTNTIERISTAKSILEYINRNKHMVLVSTHDIELTKLLQEGFDLYFFQETIDNKNLSFDYRIKKGILEQSNAIKILEIVGYPQDIVNEAKKIAAKIQDKKL